MKVGVIIGRFQTPRLHEGHLSLFDYCSDNFDQTLCLIGDRDTVRDKRNPLDYLTVKKLIESTTQTSCVARILDHPSDLEWSLNVDRIIETLFPGCDITLIGSRDSFIKHYSGKFKTEKIKSKSNHSSTDLRESYQNFITAQESWIAGNIYAVANDYPRVIPTVDIIVRNQERILIGRKKGEELWRLPGGFVNTNESFEEAAKRELLEETGLSVEGKLKFLKSYVIEDWRFKRSEHNIVTSLFECDYTFGTANGNDDLIETKWAMPKIDDLVKEHRKFYEFININR